ncbi:MAG: MerR family transcriptional regulator [Acidobacteriota bacterium]|nr:MerR family transcriptional regulator [Acidobacteriota bacterium]
MGEACRAVDIQPYVLRYWETEFPSLKPSKSKSGQRVYGDREIGIIRRIKELLYEEGYTIAGAKKRLEAEIEDGKELPTEEAGIEEAVAEAGQEVEVSTDDEADAGEVSDEDVGATTAESSQEHDEAAEEEAEAISEDTPEAIAESAGDDPAEESVDTELKQRIETLEQGVGAALDEVREALAILRDTDPNAD